MRLISNFSDYYDAAGLGFGIDEKLLYERLTKEMGREEIEEKYLKELTKFTRPLTYSIPKRSKEGVYELTPQAIGFCGKLYPLYYFSFLSYGIPKELGIYFTQSQTLSKFLLSNNLKEILEEFNKPKTKQDDWYEKNGFFPSFRAWAVDRYEDKRKEELNLFYKLGTPIFHYTNSYSKPIVINPYLKDKEFSVYIDPLNAFQEVSMFLGRLRAVGEEREYVVGGDDVVALSKGMDPKVSFHQTAPTKKQQRKINKQRKKYELN